MTILFLMVLDFAMVLAFHMGSHLIGRGKKPLQIMESHNIKRVLLEYNREVLCSAVLPSPFGDPNIHGPSNMNNFISLM